MSSFTLFTRLPPELRYRIWEMTWPEPYVIEVAYPGAPNDFYEEYHYDIPELVTLRKTSNLSTWLQFDFGNRILEDVRIEECPAPVALQVCQESRAVTLQNFALLQHLNYPNHKFYFRPERDILWLSCDVTDDPVFQSQLKHQYGQGLDSVKRVLVQENEWICTRGFQECLAMFHGLRNIELIADVSQEERSEDERNKEDELIQESIDQRLNKSWTVQHLNYFE